MFVASPLHHNFCFKILESGGNLLVEPTFPDDSIDRLSKSALTEWLKCEELVLEWNKQARTRKFYWAGHRSHYLGEYFITISCQRILDEKVDHWIGNCLIQKQDEGHLDADAVLERLGAFVWQRNCERQRSIFDKRWASATEDERGLYSIASSSWLDTVHPAYQKQIQKAVDDMEAGKRSDDILLYPRKTMTEDWMWLLVFAKVVEHSSDGSAITMEGVSLPLVSDFLHEDTTALPSKAFYDNQLSVLEALDNSPAGLYTLSFCSETSQAAFEFVSEKFCEIVGLSSAEIYASLEGAFRNIHPEDRLRWEALNAKVFKEKKDFDHTIRLVVDGVERWVRAVSLCKQSGEDKWIWSGYLVDVTAETSMAMAVSQSRKMYVNSVIDYIDKEHGRFSHSKFEQRFKELLKVLGEGSSLNISVRQGYFDNIKSVLPEDQLLDLLRVCVEVLENAVQHSRADRVMIVHSVHEGRLRIEINDNGVGIPAGVNPNAGSGLEICADIALQNGWSFNASATLGGSIVSLIV